MIEDYSNFFKWQFTFARTPARLPIRLVDTKEQPISPCRTGFFIYYLPSNEVPAAN